MGDPAATEVTASDVPLEGDCPSPSAGAAGPESPTNRSSSNGKKTAPRPALQIYRPPGLRSDPATRTKPTEAAGTKQPNPSTCNNYSSNNNHVSDETSTASKASDESDKKQLTQEETTAAPPATKQERQQKGGRGKGNNTGSRKEYGQRKEEVNNNVNIDSTKATPVLSGNLSNYPTVASLSTVHTRTSPPPSLLAQTIPPPPSMLKQQQLHQEKRHFLNASNGGCSVGERQRAGSTLSEESVHSQKSSSSSASENANVVSSSKNNRVKQLTPPVKKEKEKKRNLTPQEMLHAGVALRALGVTSAVADLERLIASEFACELSGVEVGNALACHAVENAPGASRSVAKAAQLLKDSACFPGLHRGLLAGIYSYLEVRETMRKERFRAWLALLSLIADLYSNLGDNEQGDFVTVVFETFCFLLRHPILDSVKIEELESLISTLLGIGYDLERECPDRLAELKDLIRDAFIEVSEPWARKMILLMLELSASDWKLPPEANEYYFQQTSN